MYYGVALAQIAEYPVFTSINKISGKEGMYQINEMKRILIKYATDANANGEWRFTFRPNDFDELPIFDAFIVLVCGLDTICLLSLDDDYIDKVIDTNSRSPQWINVSYPNSGQMRVRGSKGDFPYTVAHSDFPMKLFGRMNRDQEQYFSWPPFSKLNFYNRPPELILASQDRMLDLADSLMKDLSKNGRTLYFGVSTISDDWSVWDEKTLKIIEKHIRYDLEFDGYKVKIERFTEAIHPITKKKDNPCSEEFLWKLNISD